MKSLIFSGIVFLGMSLMIGCGKTSSSTSSATPSESTSSDESLTFNGALVVKENYDRTTEGGACWIYDLDKALENIGRSDWEEEQGSLNKTIQNELKIIVKNSQGETISLGNLSDAKAIKSEENPNYDWCAFPITILNLPSSDFYTVAVGSIEQTFTKNDIKEGKGNIYTEETALKNALGR